MNNVDKLIHADIIKIGESSEDALYELYIDVKKALHNQRVTSKDAKELTYVLSAIRSFITDKYSVKLSSMGRTIDNPLQNHKVYRFFS